MQRIWTGIIACSLSVVGCAETGVDEQVLSGSDTAALEALGVDRVQVVNDRFLLEDSRGGQLGEVQVASDLNVTSTFHGGRARTRRDATSTTIECNGRSAALVDGGSIPSTITTLLAPCDDALRVASILIRSRVAQPTEAADSSQSVLAQCIFLGANIYCDGTTAVVSFDSLCVNEGGGDQWVETDTFFNVGSPYCS